MVVLGGSGRGQIHAAPAVWVVAARSAVLSVITGGGKWVEITMLGHWRRGCDGALQPARRGVLLYWLDHYLN